MKSIESGFLNSGPKEPGTGRRGGGLELEKKGTVLFVTYVNAWPDPPQRQAVLSLAKIYDRVVLFQGIEDINANWVQAGNVVDYRWLDAKRTGNQATKLGRLLRFFSFRSQLQKCFLEIRPEIVATYMLHGMAALPDTAMQKKHGRLVSMIMEIPCLKDSGTIDYFVIRNGWRRLAQADVVWASDIYKANLTRQYGRLKTPPLVCHNCPTLDYLPEPTWPRDPWLRTELVQQGAKLGAAGGCILLRAGAVGECGGIEETLTVMQSLPEDFIFVMLGRPTAEYKIRLQNQIAKLGVKHRAFFWDRPSDEVWKKALQGADIGHLIHGPFPPGRIIRQYNLNSSLSNNRLFQYM